MLEVGEVLRTYSKTAEKVSHGREIPNCQQVLGSALKTWSLPQSPEANREMTCQALPDHRLAYLDYEGPISDGRGSVARWDQGMYQTVEQTSMRWVIELHGAKLDGRTTLAQQGTDTTEWTLLYVPQTSP